MPEQINKFRIHNMKPILSYTISREEVEAKNVEPFFDHFGPLVKGDCEAILLHCNALVLSIDGYNVDSRELYAIPEVRDYFSALTKRWPYWLFFLNVECESFVIPLLCLLPSLECSKFDGSFNVSARFEPEEMSVLLMELFPYMNRLCDIVDLGDDYVNRRSCAILRRVFGKEALV